MLNGGANSFLANVIKMVKEGSVTRNEAISIITATLVSISKENAESFIGRGYLVKVLLGKRIWK